MTGLHLTHAPPAARLLDAWETAADRPPAWRALALLATAHPELPREDLLAWHVGRRDLHLLALRAALFGPALPSVAHCPRCAERLELQFDAADITAPAPQAGAELTLAWDGRTLRFRLPNAGDLLVLAFCRDLDEARRLLLRRCGVDLDGVDPPALPEEALRELARMMAEADPQADVGLALRCPACDHSWTAPFDITTYLWAEVDAWARRTLGEIHTLASAYGWREAEILALSPRRRQHYLDLVASRG